MCPENLVLIDENQTEFNLAAVLWEAAERLDDAHEEWLAVRNIEL